MHTIAWRIHRMFPRDRLSRFLALVISLTAVLFSPSAFRAESAESDEDLAMFLGDYYVGDGLGTNEYLCIKRNAEFTIKSQSDTGGPCTDGGHVEVHQGVLVFHPRTEKSLKLKAFFGTVPPTLLPIRWGGRMYLVPNTDDSLLSFCNQINLGLEPRFESHGASLLRIKMDAAFIGGVRPHLEKVEDLPDLPRKWRPFLLEKSLEGKITDVFNESEAEVDYGLESGIKVGMEIYVASTVPGPDIVKRKQLIVVSDCLKNRSRVVIKERKDPLFFFERNQRASTKIPAEVPSK